MNSIMNQWIASSLTGHFNYIGMHILRPLRSGNGKMMSTVPGIIILSAV